MKNNNNGFTPLVLILIIVGMLVLGGGSYYLSKNSNKINEDSKAEENNVQKENQNDITNTSIPNNQDLNINTKKITTTQNITTNEKRSPVVPGMANPSSVYCVNNGFKNFLDSAGSVGYCVFKDGTACEEWAYINNKCVIGSSNSYDFYDELNGSVSRINQIEIIPTGSPTNVNTKDYCVNKGIIFNTDKQKLVNHLIGYYISKGGELIKTYRVDVMDISCCGNLEPKLENSVYVCK